MDAERLAEIEAFIAEEHDGEQIFDFAVELIAAVRSLTKQSERWQKSTMGEARERDQFAARIAELEAEVKRLRGESHLGLATTRELLEEISARIEVDHASGGGGLDYSTVGGSRG